MDFNQLVENDLNTSFNSSVLPPMVRRRAAVNLMPYFIVAGCIGVFGTFGNLLFILSFLKERRLRTVSNYLIGHLALVDLLTCCLVIPWNMSLTAGTESILSCQLATRTFSLFPHLSMQTQCLISCNRYFLVTKARYVYQKWFSGKFVLVYLATGWTFAIVIVILMASIAEKPLDNGIVYCDTGTDITGTRMLNYYVLGLLSLAYFVIAMVYYGKLIRFVRRCPLQLDRVKKRESKTSMTLLFLLSLFAISLLFSPVILYLNSIFKEEQNRSSLDAVDQIVSCILLINYCVNPVFYGFKIRYFKEAVKAMLFPCRTVSVSPTDHVRGPFVINPQRRIEPTDETLSSVQRNT